MNTLRGLMSLGERHATRIQKIAQDNAVRPDVRSVFMLGFAHPRPIYECLPPDVLHQDYKGVAEHLLNGLRTLLGREYDTWTQRMISMRPLHNAVVPSRAMDTPRIMAVVRRYDSEILHVGV